MKILSKKNQQESLKNLCMMQRTFRCMIDRLIDLGEESSKIGDYISVYDENAADLCTTIGGLKGLEYFLEYGVMGNEFPDEDCAKLPAW